MKTESPSPTLATEEASPWKAVYLLAVLLIAYIFSFTDRQILSLLVQPIKQDLGLSDFQMSLLQGWAFSLFYAVLGIPIAKLADRKNRRNIIAAGVALWSLMTALCGLARTFPGMFLARVGVGVGEAALSPPAYSLMSDSFSSKRLPFAMAVYGLGVSIGVGAAYLLGGLVVKLVMRTPQTVLPVVGEIHSWQAVFFIVGLPGLVVALLVLTIGEPVRKGRLRGQDGQYVVFPFRNVLRYIRQRWRLYVPLSLGLAMVSVFSYGLMAWYPTFLIRTYGMSMSQAGFTMGTIYIAFGMLGTISGPFVSSWYQRRGHKDAHVRLCATVALLSGIPGVLGPLMPEAWMALALLAPYLYIKSLYLGSAGATIQLVTPNQIRAQVSALNLFINNIVGLGIGATLIAVFTDFVFQGEQFIRYSMACSGVIASLSAWYLLKSTLKPYSQALDEAVQWEGKL